MSLLRWIRRFFSRNMECDFEDFGAGFFCHTHHQTWPQCREQGHYPNIKEDGQWRL